MNSIAWFRANLLSRLSARSMCTPLPCTTARPFAEKMESGVQNCAWRYGCNGANGVATTELVVLPTFLSLFPPSVHLIQRSHLCFSGLRSASQILWPEQKYSASLLEVPFPSLRGPSQSRPPFPPPGFVPAAVHLPLFFWLCSHSSARERAMATSVAASSSDPNPLALLASFNKDATIGATFIGFGASSVLFGVICVQTWTYLKRYPLDTWFYKVLVAVLWFLELVDQGFIGHAVYVYAISDWGSPLSLLKPPLWSLILQVTLGAVAGSLVKICFAMRVYRFSQHNKPVTAAILILAVAQLAAACVYTIQAFNIPTLLKVADLKFIGILALALGVATDIATAAALCFFLRNLRTGYSKDDSLINRMTLYAINTGVLTSAVSITTLVLYDIMPDNFIFMAFYFVLSKLYVNSFLATLNTRRVLRGRGTDNEATTMPTFLMVGKITKHEPDIEMGPTVRSLLHSTVFKQ
ncbi:hypothetical protein K474DRAFT_1702157 [Panus rudis PR-1116 ss-1]|nr:hypothetical protein K474DRAFT_1702157 [Panus rudis PR-1116 ss-1]